MRHISIFVVIIALSASLAAQNKLHDFAPVSGQSGTPVINVTGGVTIISNSAVVIPNTTLRLPLNSVNYVYLDLTLGVISVNQTGFTFGQYPIAIATTDTLQIATLQDVRSGTTSAGFSGGPVSGAGTINLIPVWTGPNSLGNSSITDNGANISTSEPFQVNGNNIAVSIFANNGIMEAQVSPSSCSGSGLANLPCGKALWGIINAPAGTTGQAAGVLGEVTNSLAWTGSPSLSGVVGNSNPNGSGNINWVAGVVGVSLPGTTGTTTNSSGLVGIGQASNAAGTTTLDGVDAQITTSATTTTTTGAGVLVRSPTLTNGTVSNLSGILIQDQTGGGGLNPSPTSIKQLGNAPNVFTGHLDQNATGNWGGTCVMTTTTCTITLTTAYTSTPGCVVTVQGSTVIAGACSISGTTVTITAASSNTATWAAFIFGNPN